MMRLHWLLLCLAICSGQVIPPYGSTPGSFTPTVPTSALPSIAPTIPAIGPFNPNAKPFLPPGYNPYNNPYYNPNPTAGPAIPILSYTNDHVGDGSYSFSFSTADGKQAQESGYLKDAYIDNAGEPQGTQVVQGSYSYIAPDGTPIQVTYVADENGFRPSGVHIRDKGLPPPTIDGKPSNLLDPYNRVDPFGRYDPYNRNRYNPFDRFNKRPQDPRYPYNNRYNPFNPVTPYQPVLPYGPTNNVASKDNPKRN